MKTSRNYFGVLSGMVGRLLSGGGFVLVVCAGGIMLVITLYSLAQKKRQGARGGPGSARVGERSCFRSWRFDDTK